MQVAHHALVDEFPEHRERIEKLISNDADFARLHDKYDSLTHQIESIEEEGMRLPDVELEKLKKERLRLKDELYAIIRT